MRTPSWANIHGLETRELRRDTALTRKRTQEFWSAFPAGALEAINLIQGSTALTLQGGLRLALPVVEHSLALTNPGDPLTGGFNDVIVPAGKQLCELDTDYSASFSSYPNGTYILGARHEWVAENPYLKNPPPLHHVGEGATEEYIDFHELTSSKQSLPVPRADYDADLAPMEITEYVDRIVLSVTRELETPADVTPLFRISWTGASFSNIKSVYSIITLDYLVTRMNALNLYVTETIYPAVTSAQRGVLDIQQRELRYVDTSRGDHKLPYEELVDKPGTATPSNSGFMSAADKAKLDGIASGATGSLTAAQVRTMVGMVNSQQSGMMSSYHFDKLNNVEERAQKNWTKDELIALLGMRKITFKLNWEMNLNETKKITINTALVKEGDFVLVSRFPYELLCTAHVQVTGRIIVTVHGTKPVIDSSVGSDETIKLAILPGDLFRA